jgi:DNA polymerase-3 subunit gamma/tau
MSYQVIARKWRPQTFGEVVGQEHVTRTLANAIRANRVAHAYIFSGPRGVGKTTTARILAKALNCVKGPTPDPCNQCDACKEITSGSSLDVMEIDAASNRGIDQVRELREIVRYAPASGRHRVIILDEAHQLTDDAANALLKTLEEPPPGVLFIMATTAPEELPDTIRSRAQSFHFRTLSFAEIISSLERIAKQEGMEIDAGALAVLARAAEGSLRDALSLTEQAVAYCGEHVSDAQVRELLGVVREEVIDEFTALLAAGSSERALALVHQLITEGHNLQHFCREAVRHVRNLLVARISGAESEMIAASKEHRARLGEQAAQFSEEDLTRFFRILLETEYDLRRKPDLQLHLEMGLLRLAGAARLAPLEQVLAGLRGESSAEHNDRPAARSHAAPQSAPLGGGRAALPSRSAEARGADDAVRKTPAAKLAPAVAPQIPIAAPPPSLVARAAGEFSGLEAVQVEAILKAVREQKKMLASLVEHVSRWELSGGEMRVFFPGDRSSLAEMLQARDALDRLRAIASEVLGQPLRVCVKLEAAQAAGAASSTSVRRGRSELRAQFERDPIVRAMLERFGGDIQDVRRRDED